MSRERRPPVPKLPPFALQGAQPARKRPYYLFIFFLLFTAPLIIIHLPLLGLPFYWDELGQFIPTALDLLRTGAWVAHSTIPNVHPPGVEAYLVLWYKLFGFSIPITRIGMLLLAGAGLLFTFLVAIELSRDTEGVPAFLPPLLLIASPLFYTQSMMAQLDMPAMVFTLFSLWLFLKGRYAGSAAASVALVLAKETGIVVPFVFFLVLMQRSDWKRAFYFAAPAAALCSWLVVLHHATGYWLGNPGFAHYNVAYSLNPVRMGLSFLRRFYYLFCAEFRWIGTLAIIYAVRRSSLFTSEQWKITLLIAGSTIALVSIFGGAELERYLLPVLPLFYIAVSVSLTLIKKWTGIVVTASLVAGLAVSLFWNPPYPFPYENNYAMVDFVRLQEKAAAFAERNLSHRTIATAWPYTAALRTPDYGFVTHPLRVIETNDLHHASVLALPPSSFDALITFTRTWSPQYSVLAVPFIRWFLTRFYDWQPEITPEACAAMGLNPIISWDLRGQRVTVYARGLHPLTHLALNCVGGADECARGMVGHHRVISDSWPRCRHLGFANTGRPKPAQFEQWHTWAGPS